MFVQALSWLLTVPGASRTVLDARVPYAQQALAGVLGGSEPASYASPQTARDMAMAAYRAAAQVATYGTPIIGLGCSCALATDRPKRGDHKASCLDALSVPELNAQHVVSAQQLAEAPHTRSSADGEAGPAGQVVVAAHSGSATTCLAVNLEKGAR